MLMLIICGWLKSQAWGPLCPRLQNRRTFGGNDIYW